jgi:hypothetical protein
LLLEAPLSIAVVARGQVGLDPSIAALSTAISIILQILFDSIAIIAYTILFHDLRNRREGTDLVERLASLQAAPVAADG